MRILRFCLLAATWPLICDSGSERRRWSRESRQLTQRFNTVETRVRLNSDYTFEWDETYRARLHSSGMNLPGGSHQLPKTKQHDSHRPHNGCSRDQSQSLSHPGHSGNPWTTITTHRLPGLSPSFKPGCWPWDQPSCSLPLSYCREMNWPKERAFRFIKSGYKSRGRSISLQRVAVQIRRGLPVVLVTNRSIHRTSNTTLFLPI